ncbi:hypothetical protein KSD_31230 [Ktedonobacter sp. SOSP1-85]|uniref:hypothetical protein n=1 Tax=Ktedonobacter sp. SOSP1-85 TaxID=2778367 RepID=UPI0019167F49|nr:hypothetical protein [Ktedonobacter sp. SOSP1-85]GHO75352.1 hypothetical protein KSD_31230 [Ktedonobacter sp. SOSP1-85]
MVQAVAETAPTVSWLVRLASTEQTGMLDERAVLPNRSCVRPGKPYTQTAHADEFSQEKASRSKNARIHNPYVMPFSYSLRS